MAKIDVTGLIYDYEPERDDKGEPKPLMYSPNTPLTFRKALSLCLNNWQANEALPTPEQKVMSFELSVRIARDDLVDLNIDELKYVKDRSAGYHTPLLDGRIRALLDGDGLVPNDERDDDADAAAD